MTESQIMEQQDCWADEAMTALAAIGCARCGRNASYTGYVMKKGPVVVVISGLSGWFIHDKLDNYWVLGNCLPELLTQLRSIGAIDQ